MMERAMRDDASRSLDNYLCLVWEQDSVKETEKPETWEKSNPLLTLNEKKKQQMTFLIHGLAEILQVVGKALLLLADVELHV